MLSRKLRIPKNLFPLLRKNKLIEGEVFDFRVTYTNNKEFKVVCVISKKIEKLATKRNKLRRRIYSIILEKEEDIKKGVYIQIFPKKNALLKNYSELKYEINNLFEKI